MSAAMKTVLVVDDEFCIRESLSELLSWEGYEVVTAMNGKEALDRLAETEISIVVLDFMMPVMNGIEMLRQMRGSAAYRHIPVVLTTAAPMSVPRDQPLWDVLLPKPFEIDELVAAVRRALGEGKAPE
jgi:CheY-like chemotaxis protein